ncbi:MULTISPECIES: hypothetical protein [unclassified Pseudomonas]|uniref:hypothetical protein n=1 Tax=unclassified Pseudomonas TaxID=196821 RepID=UPI00200F3D7E|nr:MULTISPECIES: hypothetical protein [unclassified Pseudomonas]
MSVAATPEGYAGFGWIFALWDDVGMTMLAATQPIFTAFNSSSVGLSGAVGFAWLIMTVLRAYDGLARSLASGAVIFFFVLYGMRPATVQLPSGTSVNLVEIQATPLKLAMAVHRIYRSALDGVLSEHTIAGSIIPAQAAVDDIVARGAQLYQGTDLARLIQDYNASCAPGRAELAGPEHAAKVESLHAVGLLGGGGLGIPDEQIGLLAQIKAAGDGLGKYLNGSAEENGGWLNYLLGGGAARTGLNQAVDIGSIRSRREAGMAALETSGPFQGGRYALPTQAHWQALFTGKSDATPSYLPITMIPGQKSEVVGGDNTAIMFQPSSCVEAYKIAQLGAEQAYQALKEAGGTIAGGQRVSAEVGAVSTATAWQRFMTRSLQSTTGLSKESSEIGAGVLASVQMFKDMSGWLDLQTLLPGYVMLSAWLFWLVLLAAPVALLLTPLRGARVLMSWASLLFFPVIAMLFAHALIVAVSLVMASVAIGQAAAASGWTGSGAGFDAIRGFMGAIAAILLAITTWIASSLTGVSLGGLAGSLTGAMATASGVGGFAARAVGTVMAISRLGAMRGGAVGRGGGGSGVGGSTIPPRPVSPSLAGSGSLPPVRPAPNPGASDSVAKMYWPTTPNPSGRGEVRRSRLVPPPPPR